MNTHDKIELPPLPYPQMPGNDYTASDMKEYARSAIEADRKRRDEDQQPLGYFRAEPFGWTDCAATDDGAIALYERPQAQGEPVGIPINASQAEKDAYIKGFYYGRRHTLERNPQPAEPDEWKLAVDHELTNIHSTADSFPSAKEAVKALVDWHVAVATDPVFQQPAEPVKVPSDDDLHNLWSRSGGVMRTFARAVLARYGQQAQSTDLPVTPEEEEAWQRMERRS